MAVTRIFLLTLTVAAVVSVNAGRLPSSSGLALPIDQTRPQQAPVQGSVQGYSPEYLKFLIRSATSQAITALSAGNLLFASRIFATFATLYPSNAEPLSLYSPLDKQKALKVLVDKNLTITHTITGISIAKDSTGGPAAPGNGAVASGPSNDIKEIYCEGSYTLIDRATQTIKAKGNFISTWTPSSPFVGDLENDLDYVGLSRLMWTKY
ncbi:hypothetical protein CLOM_g13011 [Closterium sp. NIES-68]|nr:hypothetical protein CLOM_g13011 [Closterium sp. NIES-68]GJP76316.1 hypothetical protein CLOP_g6780 [Closterium sp. NIES-67]